MPMSMSMSMSVTQAALDNLVPGINTDCGEECSCATCHVLIKEDWVPKARPPGDAEESMLDLNPERQTNSRLPCQIFVSEALDGLVLVLLEFLLRYFQS